MRRRSRCELKSRSVAAARRREDISRSSSPPPNMELLLSRKGRWVRFACLSEGRAAEFRDVSHRGLWPEGTSESVPPRPARGDPCRHALQVATRRKSRCAEQASPDLSETDLPAPRARRASARPGTTTDPEVNFVLTSSLQGEDTISRRRQRSHGGVRRCPVGVGRRARARGGGGAARLSLGLGWSPIVRGPMSNRRLLQSRVTLRVARGARGRQSRPCSRTA